MSDESGIPDGYAEHVPPPDLAGRIACFWTRRVTDRDAAGPAHRVLPDGCVDIIVRFESSVDSGAAMLVGPMTKPLLVDDGESALWVGARFKPGHALAALGGPAAALLDENVSLELPNTLAARSDAQTLASHYRAAVDVARRRLTGAEPPPPMVRVAVGRIVRADGNLRIASLAAEIGVTRQQLARQFATHVGVSPKFLARVMRGQAVLSRARITDEQSTDWSRIAHDLGYYDQPHFIDDFKALTGTTPSEWLATSRPFPSPASMP